MKNIKFKPLGLVLILLIIIGALLYSLPYTLTLFIKNQTAATKFAQFPVTVNPKNKTIVESATVDAYLNSAGSPMQAAVGNVFWNTFEWLAMSIADIPWYQSIAAVNGRFVNIKPGMRKEQVANAFAVPLKWDSASKQQFLTPEKNASLPLSEGSFASAVYFVGVGTTPQTAQTMVNDQFTKDVLSRYSTSTAEIVPLNQALTIASLIQRETGGNDDMRLISGIIWNRIFTNMNLQIDATLQYAKVSSATNGNWWPEVKPADKYRKSLYNTYLHPGLPPTPIASPSVAAIVAALNPTKTDCLFYFHDKTGEIHCSKTYAEHVTLLKKFYGKGK